MIAGTVSAQKYGSCNAGNLVAAVAISEGTDGKLTAFSKPLIDKGETMLKDLQQKEQLLYKDIESKTLSRVAIEQRQMELQADMQKFQDYEKETADKIEAERQKLLGPILEKVQAAIDEVAKNGSYTMIFDESIPNAILFSEPTENITDEVSSKLGVTIPKP